jgi:hypothetical protein
MTKKKFSKVNFSNLWAVDPTNNVEFYSMYFDVSSYQVILQDLSLKEINDGKLYYVIGECNENEDADKLFEVLEKEFKSKKFIGSVKYDIKNDPDSYKIDNCRDNIDFSFNEEYDSNKDYGKDDKLFCYLGEWDDRKVIKNIHILYIKSTIYYVESKEKNQRDFM